MRFFISYSRSVKKEIEEVIELLRATGNEVWWDADIPTGADWWTTILANIEWCDVFIFMISEKSAQSLYCLEELRYAIARNRPIFPFIIDDHTHYNPPPELGRGQWFIHDGKPARMLSQIRQDCEKIDRTQHKDIYAPRPVEPNTGGGTLTKQFHQAVSLAESGHFDEAINRFRSVASLDFDEWGEECQQWIAQLQMYAQIADLADHKATLNRARTKWENYGRDYDTEFDPLQVRSKITSALQRSPEPPSAVISDGFPKPEGGLRIRPAAPTDSPLPAQRLGEGQGVRAILPAPFDWIDIPAGKVTLTGGGYVPEGGKTFDVPAFAIAKYPTTNAQFQVFVGAPDGYANAEWWDYSPGAAAWRKANPKPQDRAFPDDDHPRANVTWYEAVAFCRWLSARLNDGSSVGAQRASPLQITLPTEQQWQRAAQALPDGRDSGNAYPWGKDWDAMRCNNNVDSKGIGKTTPVTQYEGKTKGDSPCGVVDMTGNVWEWCLTEYETGEDGINGTNVRLLRGGSWFNTSTSNFRADYRGWVSPDDRNDFWGFRLSHS